MIAGRRFRSRKCSVARRIACSKSGCSKSLKLRFLLRLPGVRVWQCCEHSEIESRKRIQRIPQDLQCLRAGAKLLSKGSKHRPNAGWFRIRNFDKSIEVSLLRQKRQQFANGVLLA